MKWLALLLIVWSSSTLALPSCFPRDTWVKMLTKDYDETPVSHGINMDGNLMELFVSLDGATWTLLITNPAGVSCGLGAGKHWRPTPPKFIEPMGLTI